MSVRSLIIDNYDSYTFNLFQCMADECLRGLGANPSADEVSRCMPVVIRNDQLDWPTLETLLPEFDNIIISPGPGRPDIPSDFGVCADVLRQCQLPILGVCLGHQGIGYICGGDVVAAPQVMHGRVSSIEWENSHDNLEDGPHILEGLPNPFEAVRYHSLVVSSETLPSCLQPIAWAEEKVLMALKHRYKPQWGVQFHPESVRTTHGHLILRNFRQLSLVNRCRRIESNCVGTRRRLTSLCQLLPSAANGYTVIPEHRHVCSESHAKSSKTLGRPLRVRVLRGAMIDSADVFVALYGNDELAFWLDSSKVEAGLSRFSFLGAGNSKISYSLVNRTVTTNFASATMPREQRNLTKSESFFDILQNILHNDRVDTPVLQEGRDGCFLPCTALPFSFKCGLVGYIGYEMRSEAGGNISDATPIRFSCNSLPDAAFLNVSQAIAVDHVTGDMYLMVAGGDEMSALSWLDTTQLALQKCSHVAAAALAAEAANVKNSTKSEPLHVRLGRDEARYTADVRECLRQIDIGETYEVCLTTKLTVDTGGCVMDPLLLYLRLRRRNPAPYAALLRLGKSVGSLACSSPERFLQVDANGHVESKPIKGTQRRGADPTEDAHLREELATSIKDFAENLMICDLVRNDIGLVCKVGSVHVPKLAHVETYATVHQLVTTVQGSLRAGMTAVDVVRHCFPPGSMTGAPKKRTVAILDQLEQHMPRGPYAGCLGFLSADGAADLNVVIRTIIMPTDAEPCIGAGGAIVALSDADAEFDEMLLKARAPVATLVESTSSKVEGSEKRGVIVDNVPMNRIGCLFK